MTDGPDRRPRFTSSATGEGEVSVETLASRALSVLATKRTSAVSMMSERFLRDLEAAVHGFEPGARGLVVKDMLAAGIRREDIVDFYIPEVARRLGAAWCEDGVSFADVTIGTARLQGMLRELGAAWFDEADLSADAPAVLVIVADDEFHTLGAMVLSNQLRRLGIAVKLVMGESESVLLRGVADGIYDAILISAAHGQRLASLRKLIEKVRAAAVRPTPIVLGGSVVTREQDAKTQTGADHATTDPREALRLCGLRISHQGARRRATSE